MDFVTLAHLTHDAPGTVPDRRWTVVEWAREGTGAASLSVVRRIGGDATPETPDVITRIAFGWARHAAERFEERCHGRPFPGVGAMAADAAPLVVAALLFAEAAAALGDGRVAIPCGAGLMMGVAERAEEDRLALPTATGGSGTVGWFGTTYYGRNDLTTGKRAYAARSRMVASSGALGALGRQGCSAIVDAAEGNTATTSLLAEARDEVARAWPAMLREARSAEAEVATRSRPPSRIWIGGERRKLTQR